MNRVIIYRSRGLHVEQFTLRRINIKKLNFSSKLFLHLIFQMCIFLFGKFRKPKTLMDKLDSGNLINLYGHNSNEDPHKLFMLSLLSFEKYNRTDSQTIFKVIETTEVQEIFKKNYLEIKNIWEENYPATVIYVGGDMLAVKDFEFDTLPRFGMELMGFASKTKTHTARAGNRNFIGGEAYFENYFNAEIKIVGANLDPRIWEVGESWFNDWKDYWEYEQDLWNAMFRESIKISDNSKAELKDYFAKRVKLNFQLPVNESSNIKKLNEWNGIPLGDAKLIHLHSSRDQGQALNKALHLLNGDF